MNVRLARIEDATDIAGIYAPIVRETLISFETEAPSADEMANRISDTLDFFPWLVCERDGEVVGYAYGASHRSRSAYRWSVDVSAYVRGDVRRCGVGRALYAALISILDAQGFYNAYAGITLPNEPSVGLHEAMGFRPVGVYENVGYKFDSWRDVGWWGLSIRDDRDGSPDPPIGLPSVGAGDLAEAMRLGERLLAG